MSRSRLFPAIVLVASIATLGGAFLFQYVGGLAPCVLCIYQRYPYGVTITLSILALLIANPRLRGGALLLCGLVFLVGGGIGVFHVGVEQHWWEGTAACIGNVSMGTSIEAMRQQLLSTPIVRCDRIAWSLFGISMAGYNVLVSLALALFSLWASRQVFSERSR